MEKPKWSRFWEKITTTNLIYYMVNLLILMMVYKVDKFCGFFIDQSKAELLQVGILFGTQFPSLGIFINKKVGF